MTDKALECEQVIDDLLVLIRKFASENLLFEIAEGDNHAVSVRANCIDRLRCR